MTDSGSLSYLRAALLQWYRANRRTLPWRTTSDPYRIWISETMLQQTRVAAVIPFYDRFLRQFPDAEALANAAENELLAAWAGLGYYYRARNLQKAARQIVAAGGFPRTYEAIAGLPGVGPYTAAAVSSIAFGLPHAVVDGNVYRVLSRLYNDRTNIAAPHARKHFNKLAEGALDRSAPGDFNQAVMELGATLCLPKQPQCLLCPLAAFCQARKLGDQSTLPVKIKPRVSIDQDRVLFWIARGEELLAWQRPADSRLMPGFWELPEAAQLPEAIAKERLTEFRHSITIHKFRFEVWTAELPPGASLGLCIWIRRTSCDSLPTSTVFRKALRKMTPSALSNAVTAF